MQQQQEIIVNRIFDTKNPNIKTLELKTKVLKPASANPIGFLLQGLYTNYEDRYAFVPVSTTFIDLYKIVIGTDFAKATNQLCKIVVREGFSPFKMTRDKDGRLIPQEPKKVPGISSNIYLCKDGQPIYRHTQLVMNPSEFDDVYIAHDPISEEDKELIKKEKTERKAGQDLYLFNSNIMTEPELE